MYSHGLFILIALGTVMFYRYPTHPYDWKKLLKTAFTHTGSDLLFAIEQAIATGIQYMIYNALNSNYLYLLDRYLKIKCAHTNRQVHIHHTLTYEPQCNKRWWSKSHCILKREKLYFTDTVKTITTKITVLKYIITLE